MEQGITEVMAPQLDADEAQELVDRIKGGIQVIWEDVTALYLGQGWLALGYQSWDEMSESEFAGARLRIPREQRQQTVSMLHDHGLSTRAIGSVLGISKDTAARDLTDLPVSDETPAAIVGQDGKTYPRRTEAPVQKPYRTKSAAAMAEKYAQRVAGAIDSIWETAAHAQEERDASDWDAGEWSFVVDSIRQELETAHSTIPNIIENLGKLDI